MKEHILVGLSPAPSNPRIIRTAATMAKAFRGSFTALFVRTPNHDMLSEADKERLRQNIALAQKLGASVETVFGDDVSYQIAEYARLSGVTKIVVGRSAVSKRRLFGKPTLTEKLTQIAPNIDIHIIPDANAHAVYRKKTPKRADPRIVLRDWGMTVGILILASCLAFAFFKGGFSEANIIAVYLMAVLLTAMATSTWSSYVLSAVGSILAFNYLFTHPQFSLQVYADGTALTFLIMLVASLLVGTITDQLKGQTRHSAQAAYRTNLLLETNQLLQKAQSDHQILQACRMQVSKLLGRPASVLPGKADNSEPGKAQRHLIKVRNRIYGTVLIEGTEPLEAFENSVLLSILGECALALENSRNAREKEEAKLQAENEKLRANLLRSISHDLRTPLTSISGNAGMMLWSLERLEPDTVRRMCADIYDDAAWLTNLVENLLAVTKIEEGRMELKMQPHLVEEIVAEALQHISRKQTEHIITVCHNNELLLAKCDARLIIQVIINLVDNAIKYTPAGSQIQICTCGNGANTQISVSDNGPGIPDSEKEKIFQLFYSGSNPIADCRRSMGLGLSLCRSIITAHNGTITVADNDPVGTVFTFLIPSGEVEVHE